MRSRRFLNILCTIALVISLVSPTLAAYEPYHADFASDNLQYRITDSTNNYVEVFGVASVPSEGAIKIPATVEDSSKTYTVVGIGIGAFNTNSTVTALTSLTMPDSESFTYIKGQAFANCHGITSLTIPASVTQIGSSGTMGAFFDMTTLRSVTFAEGSKLEYLGPNAFEGCSALTTLSLPDGVKTVCGDIVVGCTALTSLTIPASVTDLDPDAFLATSKGANQRYHDISKITVTSGGKYALENGVLYTSDSIIKVYAASGEVVIPEGVTTIGAQAFALQSDVTSFTIPSSVVEIGLGAFGGCTNLTSVTFDEPTSITTIPVAAFMNDTSLTSINLPESITEIGMMAFGNCTALESVDFPEGLKTIGEQAFFNCTALESVELPTGLKTIGDMSFALCNEEFVNQSPALNYINIPSSMTSLGVCFLAGVKEDGKTALIFEGASPPTFCEDEDGLTALSAVSSEYGMNSPTVYYPASAKDAYIGENSALSSLANENGAYGLTMSDPTVKVAAQSAEPTEANGNTKTFNADVPTGCTLTVESADTSIATATVGKDGKTITITSVAPGTTTITATITLNSVDYTLLETTATVTVISEDKEPAVVVATTENPKTASGVDTSENSVGAQVITALTPSEATEDDDANPGIVVTDNQTSNDALVEAASAKLQENTVSADVGAEALGAQSITGEDGDEVSIVIQPYLDVTILAVSTSSDPSTTTTTSTLKLEITPKYRTVATYADVENDEEIVLKAEEGSDKTVNAVDMNKGGTLPVSGTTTVSIPLPTDFMTGNVYIKHTKDTGRSYVYTGTIKDNVLTFENPHGFSTFEITSESPIVATITTNGVTENYASLQDAVDEVKDGGTITILKSGTATVSRTVSFTVTAKEGTNAKATITGVDQTTVTGPDANGKYVCVKSYSVTTPSKVDNGSVTVSPNSASKGDIVTVTVKPDEGYELDTLTVTDKDGKKLDLTDKGNGKYTFTMPASEVNIKAVFKKAQAPAPAPVFVDVPADAYYADAVDWAVKNGVTNGTSATEFSPNDSCTRAQMVTFLWRAVGSPEVNYSMPFTDVDEKAYYAEAVRWAVKEGVTKGTSATTFSPDAAVTRAQVVTFLYRYAEEPAVDGENPFTDVAAGEYYSDAVLWAADNDITNGTSATTFSPDSNCTRAQSVTFLYRDLAE